LPRIARFSNYWVHILRSHKSYSFDLILLVPSLCLQKIPY